jgi:hypothetical protein
MEHSVENTKYARHLEVIPMMLAEYAAAAGIYNPPVPTLQSRVIYLPLMPPCSPSLIDLVDE